MVELLVTAFHDLRDGVTADGVGGREAHRGDVARPRRWRWATRRPSTRTTSATATVGGEHVARQLIGTVLKDNPDDGKKLRHYFDVVVKQRAQREPQWQAVGARRELDALSVEPDR